MLVNLIANAREAVRAAARPPGDGLVTVGTRRASGAVMIEVADTGTGIEPAMAGQVFEPYFTTRRKGTGLGLAIARNIIEGLGGTIALTSTPGTGTVVRITLPQERRAPMTHGTVLLVDDEEKILKTLGRALREDEHEVTTTSSPQEALRLLGARQFDVLIVDYLMPGLTGMDVVRELQAALPEPERPGVLMMTAHGTVRNAVEAMKLGVRDYLQKPFDIDELLVSVRRTVEEQQARSGLRYLLSEQKSAVRPVRHRRATAARCRT